MNKEINIKIKNINYNDPDFSHFSSNEKYEDWTIVIDTNEKSFYFYYNHNGYSVDIDFKDNWTDLLDYIVWTNEIRKELLLIFFEYI